MRRRWVFRSGLLLLCGTAINVTVCWASAWWTGPLSRAVEDTWWHPMARGHDGDVHVKFMEYETLTCERRAAIAIPRFFGESRHDPFEFTPTEVLAYSNISPRNRAIPGEVGRRLKWFASPPNVVEDDGPAGLVERDAISGEQRGVPIDDLHGWPLRAMTSTGYYRRGSPIEVQNGIALEPFPPGPFNNPVESYRALPLGILWRGFATNSLVFAGALWLTLATLIAARRRYRNSRHRCTACGYDLRGQTEAGCPECGAGRASVAREVDRASE